jgi:uncharacterized RDD family membrane protein YckC
MKRSAEAAAVWRRAAAYVVDCAVVIPYGALLGLAAVLFPWLARAFSRGATAEVLQLAVMTVPFWLYLSLMESSSWRATVGKRALGIVVASAQHGGGMGLGMALVRNALKLVPWELTHAAIWQARFEGFGTWQAVEASATWVLLAAYGISALADAKRQTLYDRLARSVVVRRANDLRG